MNEPKRRGRPPKAKLLQPTEPHINGDESRQPEDVLPAKAVDVVWFAGDPLTEAGLEKALEKVWAGAAVPNPAQAYAIRVWSGQSPDVPRNERLKRVAKALEGQGLSMEGVVL